VYAVHAFSATTAMLNHAFCRVTESMGSSPVPFSPGAGCVSPAEGEFPSYHTPYAISASR